MRQKLAVAVLMLVAVACAVFAAAGSNPQVMLDNRTSYTLDLYVDDDDEPMCRALAGGFCTAHIDPGVHVLSAKKANGDWLNQTKTIDTDDPETCTWLVR